MRAKKVLTAVLIILLAVSFTGCDLISLNEEKDAKAVVAKINGTEYTKAQFNNFFRLYDMAYESYGSTTPSKGDSGYEDYKEDIFDSFVYSAAYALLAKDSGAEITDEDVQAQFDNLVEMFKYYTGSDAAYEAFLADHDLTEESFREMTEEYCTWMAYSDKYDETEPTFDEALNCTALTVDGTEVDYPTFKLYTLVTMLQNYAYYGVSPSSDSEMLSLYSYCVDPVANAAALVNYAQKEGYEISDEDAKEAFMNQFFILYYYYGETYMNSFFAQYNLSEEQIEKAVVFFGKSFVTSNLIAEEIKETIEVSDSDVYAYYLEHASSYAATVSAYHILTADEERAKQLEAEAKGTPEGFMTLYEKVNSSDDASILEAVDLGAFQYSDMVEEFSSNAFDMEVGEVRGMVQTTYGYHLIYKYDAKDAPSPETDYEVIEDDCRSAKAKEEAETRITEIEKAAKVKQVTCDKLDSQLIEEYLYDLYNVKTYPRKAVR